MSAPEAHLPPRNHEHDHAEHPGGQPAAASTPPRVSVAGPPPSAMANVSPEESSTNPASNDGINAKSTPASPTMLLAGAAEAVSVSMSSSREEAGSPSQRSREDGADGGDGHHQPAPNAMRPPRGHPAHGPPLPSHGAHGGAPPPSHRQAPQHPPPHPHYHPYYPPPPPRGSSSAPYGAPHGGPQPPPHYGAPAPYGSAKYISPQVSFSEQSHDSSSGAYKYRTPLRPSRSSESGGRGGVFEAGAGGASASYGGGEPTPPSASTASTVRSTSPYSSAGVGGRGQIRQSASYGVPGDGHGAPSFPGPPPQAHTAPSWDQHATPPSSRSRDAGDHRGDERGSRDPYHNHRGSYDRRAPAVTSQSSPYDYRQPPRWDAYGAAPPPPPAYDAWGPPPPPRAPSREEHEKPTSPFSPPVMTKSSSSRPPKEGESDDKQSVAKEVSPEGAPPQDRSYWGTPPPASDPPRDGRDSRTADARDARANSPSVSSASMSAPSRSTDSESPPRIGRVASRMSSSSREERPPRDHPYYPPPPPHGTPGSHASGSHASHGEYSSYGSLPPPPAAASHAGHPSYHQPRGPPVSPYDHHHAHHRSPYPPSDRHPPHHQSSPWAPPRSSSREPPRSSAGSSFLPPPPPPHGGPSQGSFRIGGSPSDQENRGQHIAYREAPRDHYDRRRAPPPPPHGHPGYYPPHHQSHEPSPAGHRVMAPTGPPSPPSSRQFETPVTRTGQAKFNPPLSDFMSSKGRSMSSSSSFGGHNEHQASPMQQHGGAPPPPMGGGGMPMRKIVIRKKCPWKHYPELEDFLIANREDYLRHSAKNYTSTQRKYNNRLTERLLELANRHGYVFDEHDFDFVTVRDRIRCYYKSYVQSSRKRGVDVVAPYAEEGGGGGPAKKRSKVAAANNNKVKEEGESNKVDEERQQHPEGGRDSRTTAAAPAVATM